MSLDPRELALGLALLDLIAIDLDDGGKVDDAETRSIMIGGLPVTGILAAAQSHGLNKFWMIEGIGLALGLISGVQAADVAGQIREFFERGFASGLEESREGLRPTLQVIDGGRA